VAVFPFLGLLTPVPFPLAVRVAIRAKHLEMLGFFDDHIDPATAAIKMVQVEIINYESQKS
jgi:hypothetical protein